MQSKICMKEQLLNQFVQSVKEKYPKKAFGFFLSDEPGGQPTEFVMFEKDVRNDWKDKFEQYGEYYVRNEDAGFLATQEEMYEMTQKIKRRNLNIVGVYHSHQRHPAIFSTVDVDLHPSENLWHLIISVRNIDMPQIKAFAIKDQMVNELELKILKVC